MSKERSALLVVVWLEGNIDSMSLQFSKFAEAHDIEMDDCLPNVLSEEYDSLFTKHMSKQLRVQCKKLEVELVSGSDNEESGAWYFGFGIPSIIDMPTAELLALIHDLSTVLNMAIENIDMEKPSVQNVISWF